MKKADIIDPVAYAGVPEGSEIVKRDIAPGVSVTSLDLKDKGAVLLFQAEKIREALEDFLLDVPDEAELFPVHIDQISLMVNDLFAELIEEFRLKKKDRKDFEKRRDVHLAKLEELRRQC